MCKIIQMVKISDDNSLFILGFTEENELIFRTSMIPNYIQKEKITIKDNFVYTNLYFFHLDYLKKFLNESN